MFLLVRKSKKFWENVRNWAKMYSFIVDTYFSILLFFQFFWILITFKNFLVSLSSHFFDFLSYMAGKCIFVSQMPTNSEKNPKNVQFYCQYSFFNFFVFFLDSNYFYKLSGSPIEPFCFSIFSPIWQKNSFFLCQT